MFTKMNAYINKKNYPNKKIKTKCIFWFSNKVKE